MDRLLQVVLSQRLLVLLGAGVLAAAGWRAFQQLPIDAFPDVSPTQVKIIVKAPGMTPEEIETQITARLEVELLGIPRQTMLRSIAKYALTDITIDFEDGTDLYWARQQVAERIGGVWESLPAGVEGGIAPATTPLGEMFMFTVENPALTLAERRTLLDWVIRPALRTVPGVADVNSLGGYVRSFRVTPDPAALAARGLRVGDLAEAIARNNQNDGAGRMLVGEEALVVRSEGRLEEVGDVAALVVAERAGEPIRLADVAEVSIDGVERYGAVTRGGAEEAVQGLVLGLRGANAREVVDAVAERLTEISSSFPEGTSVNVFYDRGELVETSVGTVARALAEAVVLVLLLLLLFLGDVRAALTVAVVLPLSALVTFIVMRQTGLTANLMSLGGLAIAIGILVDAAVVVVENVEARLAEAGDDARLPRLHLVYRAAREVAVPVTAGIAIIMTVFLPLLTLEGLEGKLFRPVAQTIVYALAGSLALSLTVIPVLASFLLKPGRHREPWLARTFGRLYGPSLAWALGHRGLVFALVGALLFLAASVYAMTGKTFMPTMDEGDVIIQLEKLPSITLEASVRLDQRVQAAILAAVPEVREIVARVGSDEIGMDPMSLNETDTFLVLEPVDSWREPSKDWLIGELRAVLEQFPGVAYGFTQPIEMRVSEMLTGVRGDVAVKIFGQDLEALNGAAERVARVLATVPGAGDVFTARNEGMQYLRVRFDAAEVARYGLSIATLQTELRATVEGLRAGEILEGTRRSPILIRLGDDLRRQPDRLASLPIALPGGGTVTLGMLADIALTEGIVSIQREQGQRFVVVRSNVEDRDLVGFVEEARAAVADRAALPVGYYTEWGGEFENQQRAAARLATVIPVALGLIFLVLFSTFGSVGQAMLVLSNIPLALIGGIIGLWLSGEYLSVPASIGFIALLGIAVLNGVVLVAYFNQLLARGLPLREVIVQGAARRLRPVLMTASIAAFGLVPLLFASGPGSEIQRPLAAVVIGGLFTSTLLTLIVLPIMYEWWMQRGVRHGA